MSANRLFAEWERRLSSEGLYPLDGLRGQFSTFRVRSESTTHVSLPSSLSTDLPDHDGARFWRLAGIAVHELPGNHPRRRFLVAVCASGNLDGERREAGLTRSAARVAWRRFVVRCGLRDPFDFPRVPRQAQPVAKGRRLTRKEIARLNLAPPRRR